MLEVMSHSRLPESGGRPATTVASLPPLDLSLPPWPGSYERGNGWSLYVRRTDHARSWPASQQRDTRDVAVYLHGLGGSSTNWTDLGYQLASWAHGIAVDLPGFGFSEPDEGFDLSMTSQADRIARYVADLGAGPVYLVGNSMGGTVAILLAARRPELVRTLTLISPAVPDFRPDPWRISDPRVLLTPLPLIGKRMRRELAALGPRERARQIIELCCADPDGFPPNRFAEIVEEHTARMDLPWAMPSLTRSGVELLRGWLRIGRGSLRAALRRVTAPTLVVWGTDDRVVSPRRAAPTVHALQRGRLLMLRESGHVAQMEHPTTVASATLALWQAERTGRW
ncbi:alpha/beta hydrolase [Haloechinothrix sp. LS1_15]|nr:alpha/beta hydrolase [Haloechinothrix sp. LS1_15]